MIAQNIIIMVLSILALVHSISSRPYINTTLAARQTNTTVVARQLTGPANVGGLDLNSGTLTGGLTLQQATEICGNAQLNCCSQASGSGGVTGSGLIGAVFGSGGPGIQCNLMNFPIVGPQASMAINELCEAKVACCKGQTSQANLLDLNCIALSSLI